MISKLVKFADAALIAGFKFFSLTQLDETIANTYILAIFHCFGKIIHCLKISGNKNNLTLVRLGFFGVPGPEGGGGGLQKPSLHKSEGIEAIVMKLGG